MAAEFEKIWDIYPKRVKEIESFGCYNARRREGVSFRVLYEAVVAFKAERKGEPAKYTIGGDVFFGTNHRYRDYDGKADKGSNGKTTMDPKRSAAQRRMQQEEDEAWEKRQKTEETQTTDPSQTMKSATERLKDL
jgi:hypothetical protein